MSIFDRLSEADADALRRAGTPVTSPEGWALLAEQTPSDKAYVIVSGEASVRKGGAEIARLGTGDLFGECGIVHSKLRSATVVALTRLDLLHYTDERLRELTTSVPGLAAARDEQANERLTRD